MTSAFNGVTDAPIRGNEKAKSFCDGFLNKPGNRWVFGCNAWAAGIAERVDIDGFIDDFSAAEVFCGRPVIRSTEIPSGARVVSAVVGERPLTVQRHIAACGVEGIDYYAFQKYSGLNLPDVLFLGDFKEEFEAHQEAYEGLARRLKDDESRRVLRSLLNFRLSRDIAYMEGFSDAQERQYFEPFLNLRRQGETFLDIGCYDGYTSAEFIRRCPEYRAIHVFEPEPENMENVKARLRGYRDIRYHPYGASDRAAVLRFESGGSASRLSASGALTINVERIDDVVEDPYTFLKMDIEGGEVPALHGALQTIERYQPKLALSVYHKADDLRVIPDLVLSCRDDYDVHLRHYTEGPVETVMFFVPGSRV